ncbi:hypothetical protein BN1708_010655 [Verticillium longisporum]|uniref:Uncharacterized protein n=1 Tax=Verticillium longisporum TaxID=100787 RepID=A0A0G4KTA3_VERLO|nr:hypothetical protein BN1708_010655 [Verticillium longisporum]
MERDTTWRPSEVVLTDRSSAKSNHFIIASGQAHSMLQLKIQLQRLSHQPCQRWTVGLQNMALSRL